MELQERPLIALLDGDELDSHLEENMTIRSESDG